MSARDDYPAAWEYVDDGEATAFTVSEIEAMFDEIDRLRHWKSEASIVIDWWEDVWRVLGEPGGLGQFKSHACVAEIGRLREQNAALTLDATRAQDAFDDCARRLAESWSREVALQQRPEYDHRAEVVRILREERHVEESE